MARHPEVSEKSIVQAGLELEKLGKTPNPGAVRAHLGYKGGLMRIKSVWENFAKKREHDLLPEHSTELSFDALPDNYATNASHLMERVTAAIEQLTVEAYVHSQRLFEKRLKTLENTNQQKLDYYVESEVAADQCITRLETEADDLQRELQQLADQNAKLLIENSELRGRLAVFDERFNTKDGKQAAKL